MVKLKIDFLFFNNHKLKKNVKENFFSFSPVLLFF